MAYIDVDKDIRYFTDTLEERIDNRQEEVNTLMDDVDGLRVTIQELVAVTKKHDAKLLAIATSLDTINQMLKMLSDKVYVPIEPAPDIGLDDDYRE